MTTLKIFLCVLVTPLFGAEEEELLFARRIMECWNDQDIALSKSQIELFFTQYPKSSYRESFYAILGDIALRERAYPQAIAFYEKISDPDILRKVQAQRWYALYQMQKFSLLYEEIQPRLRFAEDEATLFYFSEAAFRLALEIKDPAQEERKTLLFQEALHLYNRLQFSETFADQALLSMGEIHKLLGNYKEAADVYKRLAEEKKSHEALFQCALMLSKCQEKKATEIFSQIVRGGGKYASAAAYEWMQLLAKEARFEEIAKEPFLLDILSEKHIPLYHYYMGIFHKEQQHWNEALFYLEKSLISGLKPPHDRGALLALLEVAKAKEAIKSADMAFLLIKERYPEHYEEAALLRALTYRQSHRDQIALALFSELISVAEKPPFLEAAYLEKTSLLLEGKELQRAHDLVHSYLKRFPASSHRGEMLRLAIDLSLARVEEDQGYERLMTDLEAALDTPGLFSEKEEMAKYLLLAKCYLKEEKPTSAHYLLSDLLERGEESAELHYLLVLSLVKEGQEPEKLLYHGERALALDSDFAEKDRLHLYLFNSYLSLSKRVEDPTLHAKAADHLYAIIDKLSISLENQLWLAHTYAKQEKTKERAIHILEGMLQSQEAICRFSQEAILLASLYEEKDLLPEAQFLLTALQDHNPTPASGLLFGKILREEGCYLQAKALLAPLERSLDLAIALPAKLESARISLLTEEDHHLAMRTLRELWLQKSLHREPLHLEAALEYAEATPFEKKLKVYDAIREHFIAQNDICSKDYHEERLANPDKDRIYQAYMRFLEVKVLLTLAEIEEKAHKNGLAKRQMAKTLLDSLQEGNYTLTKYLRNEIHKAQVATQ